MLESVKINRRQSEIRQALAELVGKEKPTDDEVRHLGELDKEFRNNEVKYRAALLLETEERQKAGSELETREGRQWGDLLSKIQFRQVVLALDEGAALSGETAEIVQEMRSKGGYRGIPVPLMALQRVTFEKRVGETIASGVPDPKDTRPIIDRLFPASVAARMGAELVNIDQGLVEWPIVTSSVASAWQATETGSVGTPSAFATLDRPLAPNQTLGVQMKITRRSLKQSGDALEAAVRRDMSGAIEAALDKAVFLGAGSSGEPAGVLVGSYSITSTTVSAAATWSGFRGAAVRFMKDNAAGGPGDINLLIRPEVYDKLDGTLITNTAVSEWDRLVANIPISSVVLSSNALAAPTGSPSAVSALLTTNAGGVAPIYVGTWGGIDMIRDPYSDAASGGLRITGLVTADVTVGRPSQLQILTGVQV
jgi:HK97 family phage major capsid protein